jgi:hypothetical protein
MADIANIALYVSNVDVFVYHRPTSLQRAVRASCVAIDLHMSHIYIAIKSVNGNIDTKLHDCII